MAIDRWPMARTTHHAMGTVMAHSACGPDAEAALNAACREVARLEGLLSCFRPESEIGRVNARAGASAVPVSPETYAVLSSGLDAGTRFAGCFDVTIGPLVALWRSARASLAPPDAAGIERALPLVDYRDLLLDSRKGTAALRHPGQSVDLGGIGKGLAGDSIREVLRRCGVGSAYSNLGGNVVTLGAKPDGSPWQIGIQHPREERGLVGAVAVVDEAVVTSGDYQRYFTDRNGRRHHHILDPTTGYPAASGLVSVTIVAGDSLVADVLSTALFVAGMEKGLEHLGRFPGAGAVFVDAGLRVYVTEGLRSRFRPAEGVRSAALN